MLGGYKRNKFHDLFGYHGCHNNPDTSDVCVFHALYRAVEALSSPLKQSLTYHRMMSNSLYSKKWTWASYPLLLPSKGWNYICAPMLVYIMLKTEVKAPHMLGKHPTNWAISLVPSTVILEYQNYSPKRSRRIPPLTEPSFLLESAPTERFVKQDFQLLILSLRRVTKSRTKLNIWTKHYLLLLVISKNLWRKQIQTFWGNKLAPGSSTELSIKCAQI